jgi:hypothetical protein
MSHFKFKFDLCLFLSDWKFGRRRIAGYVTDEEFSMWQKGAKANSNKNSLLKFKMTHYLCINFFDYICGLINSITYGNNILYSGRWQAAGSVHTR